MAKVPERRIVLRDRLVHAASDRLGEVLALCEERLPRKDIAFFIEVRIPPIVSAQIAAS